MGCFDGGGHDLGAPRAVLRNRDKASLGKETHGELPSAGQNPTVASATFKASLGPEWAALKKHNRRSVHPERPARPVIEGPG